MAETERLDKLEESVRKTQDSMLLMGKDIHQMNQNITSIASSMKALVEVQQNMRLTEERSEARHAQLKDADKLLHSRLDQLTANKKTIEEHAENGNKAYGIMIFIAKTLGTATLMTVFGIMLWLIQLKG